MEVQRSVFDRESSEAISERSILLLWLVIADVREKFHYEHVKLTAKRGKKGLIALLAQAISSFFLLFHFWRLSTRFSDSIMTYLNPAISLFAS
jgi:hypothetical protein